MRVFILRVLLRGISSGYLSCDCLANYESTFLLTCEGISLCLLVSENDSS